MSIFEKWKTKKDTEDILSQVGGTEEEISNEDGAEEISSTGEGKMEIVQEKSLETEKTEVEPEVEEEPMPCDAAIAVEIASDKLCAYVKITAPAHGGNDIAKETIEEALAAKQVIYGIDQEKMQEIADQKIYEQEIQVAWGRPAVDGRNGSIELLFGQGEAPMETSKDGTVDLYAMKNVETVEAGQKLCKKLPAIDGANGMDVLGREIFAKIGKSVSLPTGKNTLFEQAGDEEYLIAAIAGQVVYKGNVVEVTKTYEVKGDVDVATGNINFGGSVSIKGNVFAGFCVEAGGNIDIQGVVEGAKIKAGGNLTVRGGINGMGSGQEIQCHGDLSCKYIENANITAFGKITCQAVMNSMVMCSGNLEVQGERSSIMGGKCIVGGNVSAKNIGTVAYLETIIEAGTDPTLSVQQKELELQQTDIIKQLDDLDKLIQLFTKKKEQGELEAEKERTLESAKATRTVLLQSKANMEEQQKEIALKIGETFHAKVTGRKVIYPGVRVRIGNAVINVQNEIEKRSLLNKDGKIVEV